MKRQLSATLQRSVRRASTWRPKASGEEHIDIRRLISPLRYDVMVRADFFGLVEEMDESSVDDVIEAARATPYHRWFTQVAMTRYRPWVLADQGTLDLTFAQRVASARLLSRSVRERGFDHRHKIVLRWTPAGTTDELGVPMARELHVGDGGHRLAMLMRGSGILEPTMYVVDPRPMPLIDNTVRLFSAADVESPVYLGFLAGGYTQSRPECAADLLSLVEEEEGPEAATELRAVMASHRMVWRADRTPSRLA